MTDKKRTEIKQKEALVPTKGTSNPLLINEREIEKFREQLIEEYQTDITAVIKYEEEKKELTQVDLMSGPMYMKDFNRAFDLLSGAIGKLKTRLISAQSHLDEQEALAKFERAPEYFKDKGIPNNQIKDSISLRESYLPLDKEYRKAKERVEAMKALIWWLESWRKTFQMAHDDAKKIFASFMENSRGGHSGITSGGSTGKRWE